MKESKCYTPTGFGQYAEGYGTLRACGGDIGGGTEMLVLTYNQISQSAGYSEDDTSVSLTVCGGSYGGGSETLVVYYIQDEPTPKIGGALPSPLKQNGKDV